MHQSTPSAARGRPVNTPLSSSASKIRDTREYRFLPVEQCLPRARFGRQDLVYPKYAVTDLAPHREYKDDVRVGAPGGVRLRLLNLDTVADPQLLHPDGRTLGRGGVKTVVRGGGGEARDVCVGVAVVASGDEAESLAVMSQSTSAITANTMIT